uniref:Uncharacterized protein n=1 Tax=Scophthalmus maximus TaxID=52904 RepID=A0A8D3ATH6_SCOMX
VAELMEATLPSAGSGLAALWLESGAGAVLVFAVGVLRFDVREERRLVQEDLRAVDALQVGSVRQLRVSGQDVFLQLVSLAERLLAIVAHVQVLLQVPVSSLLPPVPLTPQCEVLSVLAVSLPESEGRDF